MEGVIATILLFAGNFAPRNWAFCAGQLLAISQYQSLFSLLGTTYGGDGRTTFALPDLRGRVAVGAGDGPGLTPVPLGSRAGSEQTRLTLANLPTHTHAASLENGTLRVASADGSHASPVGHVPAQANIKPRGGGSITGNIYGDSPDAAMAADIVTGTVEVGPAGNDTPFDNHQPYTALNYIICMNGIYPSRS